MAPPGALAARECGVGQACAAGAGAGAAPCWKAGALALSAVAAAGARAGAASGRRMESGRGGAHIGSRLSGSGAMGAGGADSGKPCGRALSQPALRGCPLPRAVT